MSYFNEIPECQGTNDQDCGLCREKKCATCEAGKPCLECNFFSSDICFSFCNNASPDFEIKEDPTTQWIDFKRWMELYPIVKCVKYRGSKKLNYFPAFCQTHCKVFHDINTYWNNLSDPIQDLLLFMFSSQKCDIVAFLELLQFPEYESMPYETLLQVLFSPLGIMAIDPLYYVIILSGYMQEITYQYQKQRFQALHQNGTLSFDSAVTVLQEDIMSLRTQDYSFLIQFLAQPATVSWLLPEFAPLKVLHWNMLNYKLTLMFLSSVSDKMVTDFIPFSEDWSTQWSNKASEYFGDVLFRDEFRMPWQQLMNATNQTVMLTQSSLQKEERVLNFLKLPTFPVFSLDDKECRQ